MMCVYVCMYVCVYVCMYVRTYVRTYVCMYVRMIVCMYVCIHMYIYIYIYVHSHHWSSQETVYTGVPQHGAFFALASVQSLRAEWFRREKLKEHLPQTNTYTTHGLLNSGKERNRFGPSFDIGISTRVQISLRSAWLLIYIYIYTIRYIYIYIYTYIHIYSVYIYIYIYIYIILLYRIVSYQIILRRRPVWSCFGSCRSRPARGQRGCRQAPRASESPASKDFR